MQKQYFDSPAVDVSEQPTQRAASQPWTVVFRKAETGALWKMTAIADGPDAALRAVCYDQDLSSDQVLAVIDPHSLR